MTLLQPAHAGSDSAAVVDIGSNSIRLVCFDGAKRAPVAMFNEKGLIGLGRGLATDNRLAPQAMAEALEVLERFVTLVRASGIARLDVLATAAVRDAENGQEFTREVARRCGVGVRVVSGEEEARLSALGVLSGIPDADGVMADLGGGSIELVRLERAAATRGADEPPGTAPGRRLYIVDEAMRQGEKLRSLVGRRFPAVPWLAGVAKEQGSGAAERAAGVGRDMMATLPLGPLRVVEEAQRRGEKLRALVERHLASVPWLKDAARGRAFYPVGGAWRNLAKIHIQQSRYPLQVIQGYTISAGEARNLARLIAAMSKASVASLKGVSRRRAEVLPIAALVLDCVLEATAAREVVFSAQGLREGFLFSLLAPDVAASDPLLALCSEMDERESRFGPVGTNLARWTAGLFPSESEADARLRRAACHLSDAYWRAHPDYRADLAFRQVLLGPFTGITHAERAFLALAIHARYGGTPSEDVVEPALRLVAETAADRAHFLGAALRLGFAYCGANTQLLPPTTLTVAPGILRFAVPAGAHAQLAAGLVERRLDSAAKAGRLKPDLRIET